MKHFDQFFKHLKTKRLAENTITFYFYFLRKTARYFASCGIKDEKLITEGHIAGLIAYLKNDIESDYITYNLLTTLKLKIIKPSQNTPPLLIKLQILRSKIDIVPKIIYPKRKKQI